VIFQSVCPVVPGTTRRWSRVVVAVAVTATSLAGAVVSAPASSASSGDQAAFVAQINGARASRGLPALPVNGSLVNVAQDWAAPMAAAGALSHNPNLAYQVPPGWRIIEENVGMGPSDGSIESSFAASPQHYANMVNSGVTEVGVGVVSSGGYFWVVEDFWGGSSVPPPASPPPASAPPPIRPTGFTAAPAPSSSLPAPTEPPYWGPVLRRSPATTTSTTTKRPAPVQAAPVATGPTVDLDAIANQVQYFDTWD
jgi:uncharacterized protein YkwD